MRVVLDKLRFQDKVLAGGFRGLMRVVLDKREVPESDVIKMLMRVFLDKTLSSKRGVQTSGSGVRRYIESLD